MEEGVGITCHQAPLPADRASPRGHHLAVSWPSVACGELSGSSGLLVS